MSSKMEPYSGKLLFNFQCGNAAILQFKYEMNLDVPTQKPT